MPAPDASDDLSLLEDAVREAGDIALSFYGGDYKRWSKEGGSPVTEADLAVDKFLHDTADGGASRLWLAVGRKRRRSGAADAATGSSSSIPSTAPSPFSRTGRISPSAPRW